MNTPQRNTREQGVPSGGPPDSSGSGKTPAPPRMSPNSWLTMIIVFALFNLIFYLPLLLQRSPSTPQVSVPYSTFIAQVRANNVATAHLVSDAVSGAFKKPYTDPATKKAYPGYTTTLLPLPDSGLVPLLIDSKVQVTGGVHPLPWWLSILSILWPFLPVLLLMGLLLGGTQAARRQQQGMFGVGKSRAKLYTAEHPSTTFADVAGVEAAKAELREEVDFLRDPTKYHQLGARIPKGALLVGPPGTGKTLLARAVAGEARVPFFSISATEFVEMFVGVGASRVRDLFEKAKAAAPAIIFIDEIDAIGRQRGGGSPLGSNDEREQTLNQLLVCMDGFEPNQALIVLAATNRPDVLDSALLRPGRFDRQITVDPPGRHGREAILSMHTRGIPLASAVDLRALAQATPGISGAALANLANEAALTAARRGQSHVTPHDFEEALDRITLGALGSALMGEEERRTAAYHEAGHALVAFLVPGVDPVHRVTITPRGRSLGVTQFRPIDDRRNYSRTYLFNRMVVGLGGRAAEEVACGEITSGAQNDLQEISRLAHAMVTQLGMADELGVAYFGSARDDAMNSRMSVPWEAKEYSEETVRRIDAAVQRLIEEAHQQARSLLTDHRVLLDAIAETLIRDESLDRDQLATMVAAYAPGPVQHVVPKALVAAATIPSW